MRAVPWGLVFVAASVAGGQERERCLLIPTPQTTLTRVQTASGESNTFMGRGVRISCPTKGLRIRADSLESYGDDGRIYLIDSVFYEEPRLTLTSNYLTYFQREERVVANGSVDARLPSGSTMRGPFAEYFRAIPGSRPATRLVANGRPTFHIVQRDSAGQPGEPLVVVANNVTMVGDSLVYAGGTVRATRPEVEARGDSMTLDSDGGIMVMMRQPEIEGKGTRRFTLSGERIVLTSKERKLERVVALGTGKAVSEDMTLTSDTIDLRVARDLLQRAIAWGPSRARAFSPTQRVTSDSLDVLMPDQRVRVMYAVRGAIAEGTPDTTRFRADTVDWLRGDTVVARFDSVAPADSTRNPPLRELVARGGARAYYHVNPADTAARRPAINYVTGKEIVIAFEDRKVARVTVVDQAAGVYLEPRADTVRVSPPGPATRPPQAPANRPAATPPAGQPTTRPPASRPPE